MFCVTLNRWPRGVHVKAALSVSEGPATVGP